MNRLPDRARGGFGRLCLAAAVLLVAGVALTANAIRPVPTYRSNLSRATTAEVAWVDSIFNAMTFDERLGQLFMIRAHSDLGADHVAAVEKLIRDYHVGGLCFFQGTPEEQLRLTNRYQTLSRLPLMISMDAEWGLGMRMPASTISFPRQLTLGAIQDNRLIYDMGREIARQLQRMGVHVSFSPVLDVNNNPGNPVIATRSFGEDRYNVTVKSYMYMQGLQDNGILACAKHFPGHGDTNVDSHHDLPVIAYPLDRLDSIELYPFRALVQHGIGSVMVGHLEVPALESRRNRPTSLSRETVTELLREDMNFTGLIFTDGLEMQGVTKHFQPGEAEAEALLAGNDVLLLPKSVAAAFASIKQYIAQGKLSRESVERSVKRVLLAKYRLGLTHFTPLPELNVRQDLNSAAATNLKQQLLENALTLVRDPNNLLPIARIDSAELAALSFGADSRPPFHSRLTDYADVELLRTGSSPSAAEQQELLRRLGKKDVVFVSFHAGGRSFLEPVEVSPAAVSFLRQLQERTQVVAVVFGSPYALSRLDPIEHVIAAYTNDPLAQDVAAQAIFGAIGMSGRLPITASERSRFNAGVMTRRNFRMGYAVPERVGLFSDSLHRQIDRLALEAIEAQATPGCVVLVARQGRIVLEKAYGFHTYAKKEPVQVDDIYDLASITKVAATTLAVMDLYDQGKIGLETPLGQYLPELRGTDKDSLTIGEILAHQAGLQAWIPFYTRTLSGSRKAPRPSPRFYQPAKQGTFSVEVTNKLFLHQGYVDSIWNQIVRSQLRNEGRYLYSDLGFYLLERLVHRVSGQPLDAYVQERFYRPLGLHELTFRPLRRFPPNRIVPTEEDYYFRRQRIHGYVHDMGAAMLGGVSGHAGLFGSAHDLAVLMQMLLQRGNYAGRQYLSPQTVTLFTTRYPGATRRGLGFDMKQINTNLALNMSRLASDRTFGHVGFTGTSVWADPKEDLIVVFLSNRTYPSMRNYRINSLNTRPRIQGAVYKSINPSAPLEALNRRYIPGLL